MVEHVTNFCAGAAQSLLRFALDIKGANLNNPPGAAGTTLTALEPLGVLSCSYARTSRSLPLDRILERALVAAKRRVWPSARRTGSQRGSQGLPSTAPS